MRYAYVKDVDTGQSKLVEVSETEEMPITLSTPPSATLEINAAKLICMAQDCGKMFRTAGIAAMHFKKAHPDLWKDKNSWKEFTRKAD